MKSMNKSALLAIALILFIPITLSAQWVQTSGPSGGNIRALAISDSNLFAGTTGGGVYLSTNNGIDWNAVNNGLPDDDVWDFAISGSNIFAGTDYGVFLSIDNSTH